MENETARMGTETKIEASHTQEKRHTKNPLIVQDNQVTLDSDVGPLPASAFPHGVRLLMILVGLGLATFLAAIDMVS